MSIKVTKKLFKEASFDNVCEWHKERYLDYDGLRIRETRAFERMSDTMEYVEFRDSLDNGKTWCEWQINPIEGRNSIGEDEYEWFSDTSSCDIWNPVHKHSITLRMLRIFMGGYLVGGDLDSKCITGFYDHGFLEVTDESGTYKQMVAYEDGITEFDEKTYRDDEFLKKNNGVTYKAIVLSDGDLLIGVEGIPMYKVCDMLNLDINEVFPSRPEYECGILMCRGKWNKEEKKYDLTFSKPLYLPDVQSSRGLMEPTFIELKDNKILLVMRGSNFVPPWFKDCCPYTPGFKYFSISKDGGRTFSSVLPWFFDSKEVVYSSSTYSLLFRSIKNEKVYWVGNITDPTKTDGNYPRFPLQIAEVDEKWGILKKDTVTIIDDKADGESEKMQLSNFCILQNRETGNVEICMTKLGQYDDRSTYNGDVLKYIIEIPNE